MELYPKADLYRRIVQAKLFMDAHYAEPIDADLISGEAAFSKFHFIRSFKQVYGTTPRAYLSNVRLDRAKLLLEDGLSIADACHDVGFESIPSFSRSFKYRVGLSPSEYRKQCEERARSIEARPMEHIPPCYAQWMGLKPLSNPG